MGNDKGELETFEDAEKFENRNFITKFFSWNTPGGGKRLI
jgi:hypothetical protein